MIEAQAADVRKHQEGCDHTHRSAPTGSRARRHPRRHPAASQV